MDAAEHLKGMAYHEAGHAVVAWALGLPIGNVYVRKMGEGDGGAQIACVYTLSFVDRLAVCLAGIQAAFVFNAQQPEGMGGRDIGMVMNLLSGTCETHGAMLRDQGRARASHLLVEHRDHVTRLAERLIHVHHVDAAEFMHLMLGRANATPPRAPAAPPRYSDFST